MEKRICPKCQKTWYSADTRTWICDNCGAKMPPILSCNKNVTGVGRRINYRSNKKFISFNNTNR
ncbi:MAG: hypothetical protein PHY77_08740 [Desulfotomaculaceae bacterium]|nr:hypothetical protein [Desulfotomaculaceae bacterium]